MTQIMILQSIYTAISMITVIPFGILADYIGRKKVLIASTIIYTFSWILFAMSYTFKQFLLAETAAALSASTFVASGTAFFYDNLRELKREKQFKKLFGNVISINYLIWGIAALIGGYMAIKSLRFPYWAAVFTSFIALIISFTLTETKK